MATAIDRKSGAVQSLAVFGAAPMFSLARTTAQLANRDPARFFELMEGAFERRRLSNQGPLVCELEERLCELHCARHCVSFANASFALILALHSLARRGRHKVLLPSMTFRGLPHVIRWANLEPEYCDVDPAGYTLDPKRMAERMGGDTAAVLAVENVNALCDIDAIEEGATVAGVPLVIDAVYGVGGTYGSGPVGSRGSVSVFSLHASKLINGFEGGYAVTNDDGLAELLRSQRTFGYAESSGPERLGLNAKLNEVHAAMALSNLPHIGSIVRENAERFAAYRDYFQPIPWVSFADYSRSPGTYSLVLLKVEACSPYTREELMGILRAENALVRPYYSPPLHSHDSSWPGPPLPVSESASKDFIQMPAGDLVTIQDVERLAELFLNLDRHASAVLSRLRSARQ